MPNNPAIPSEQSRDRQTVSAWEELARHKESLAGTTISALFEPPAEIEEETEYKSRADIFSQSHDGFFIDYSKHAITEDTIDFLVDLAKTCDVEGVRAAMFAGDVINLSENRAVLHTALRDGENKYLPPAIAADIAGTLEKIRVLSDTIRADKTIKAVVTIGIGGSDTGPHLVCDALKYMTDGPEVRFLSNIDPGHFTATLTGLTPESTLFVIASKSFSTQEILTNASSAQNWAKEQNDRFIAVTGNRDAAREFGISEEHILPVPDWVGGRYSLWSRWGCPLQYPLVLKISKNCWKAPAAPMIISVLHR